MADHVVITDEMRALIGRDSESWTCEITSTSVRAFARGVGYLDRVYYDEEAARAAGHRSLPCPPTYLGTPVFVPGETHDTFSEPTALAARVVRDLRHVIDGEVEVEYFADLCAGDVLAARMTISGLEVRRSLSYGEMLAVTTRTTYTNAQGQLVAAQCNQRLFY